MSQNSIGSGNGLVPSDNKPLPEPVLTKISNAIWYHHAGHNDMISIYTGLFLPSQHKENRHFLHCMITQGHLKLTVSHNDTLSTDMYVFTVHYHNFHKVNQFKICKYFEDICFLEAVL